MATEFKLPDKKAVVFWPIGTGDSTTVVPRVGEIFVQIDLRHLEKADDPEKPEWPIIDDLVRLLPKRNGRPYLALFVLTHPDKDHIQGFAELQKRVSIGELWHTPMIFRASYKAGELCDDAEVFRKEVERRRKAILADPGNVRSGNRLRIIGHDSILTGPDYKALPPQCKSRPGEKVSTVDGVDLNDFQVFIHAPFKDEQDSDKNDASLSLNVVIWEGQNYGQVFFFGDRQYPTIKKIFETTEANKENVPYLKWDVMLSAHHCSKAVMYWKDEGEKDETFRKDIMDYFEKHARAGYVVASAHSDFTDKEGKNPPHKKARERYEKIVKPGRFVCTHEYPSKQSPEPLVFTIDSNGFGFDDHRKQGKGPAALAAAVGGARGGSQPPKVQVGFGPKK